MLTNSVLHGNGRNNGHINSRLNQSDFESACSPGFDAETIILGSMLGGTTSPDDLQGLKPSHFRNPSHREIFKAAMKVTTENGAIDAATVAEILHRGMRLDAIGGVD